MGEPTFAPRDGDPAIGTAAANTTRNNEPSQGTCSRSQRPGRPRRAAHGSREAEAAQPDQAHPRSMGAVEELLDGDVDCERALHTLAACRGAINSLMGEILEDHIATMSFDS